MFCYGRRFEAYPLSFDGVLGGFQMIQGQQTVNRARRTLRQSRCYSVTVFTKQWSEVRDFYTRLLGAEIISERQYRYCDLIVGGVPLSFRACDDCEIVSHFHLYLAFGGRDQLLERLREAGVIVRIEEPYASFLDPDGRTIKVSEVVAVMR